MGAISLWSYLRIRGEILSGPAPFPGFNLRSCLDTPETDIVMFCIDGELSFLGSTVNGPVPNHFYFKAYSK